MKFDEKSKIDNSKEIIHNRSRVTLTMLMKSFACLGAFLMHN